MAIDAGKQLNLNFDILPKETKVALDFLRGQSWLKNDDWYLAGGTALALQAGHRKSFDLDFFNKKGVFDNVGLIENFSDNNDWEMTINKENTIYGKLSGAKVSFIAYPFFVPDKEFIKYGTINILSVRDVAVMKIIAISQRGRKRDFFDLYWCAKNIEPLEETIKRLKKQYPSVAHDYYHIMKSLAYFDDAESDPDLELNFKTNWLEVKKYFAKEVPQIMKKIMELK
ncbi:MAG: nucleotidyl transferase AbiEii/AbiGii toxin family protein [Candidatus Paceibacterota bacterium]